MKMTVNKGSRVLTAVVLLTLLLVFLLAEGCNNSSSGETANSTNITKRYPIVYGFEVDYCEKLGYIYEYRLNESTGKMEEYCRLSPEIECEAWAFAGGECHTEFMLCKKQGYLPKIGVENRSGTILKYPICIFPDGTYCKEKDFLEHNCHVDWE